MFVPIGQIDWKKPRSNVRINKGERRDIVIIIMGDKTTEDMPTRANATMLVCYRRQSTVVDV